MHRIIAVTALVSILGAAGAESASSTPAAPRAQCLSGPRAQRFLEDVRSQFTRSADGLEAAAPSTVQLVTSDSLCVIAAHAYANDAGPADGRTPPFVVAVAVAPKYYIVELGETAGAEPEAEYWEVVVYDRQWKRIASYGRGA